MSAIDTQGENETLTNLCLHLILILIEYKPPSIDNLRYLINGGHPTLKKVFNSFANQMTSSEGADQAAINQGLIEDLTINKHYRLLKLVHGKINLDPLYRGLIQYFQNVINC